MSVKTKNPHNREEALLTLFGPSKVKEYQLKV